MKIAYVAQAAKTGARAQAEVLADHLDEVDLVRGTVQDVEAPAEPYTRDERGVVYPTSSLFEALRALDPDLVFVHIFNQVVISDIARIQTCFPTVMRAGLNFNESFYSGNLAQAGVDITIQTLQSFDHLIAPSTDTRDDLECLGIAPERVTVIPTAIPMGDRVREPDVTAPMRIGCLSGRITPLKNQHTLVMALGGLRAIEPTLKAECVLTGEGADYGRAVRKLASTFGMAGAVDFAGFVGDPHAEFFPTIGVHCVPSHSERLSSAVLEGARAGVATVISDSAWADSFDSLLAVQPDDPMAWAETVAQLLTNDSYRLQVARAQQAEIVDGFDVVDVIDDYRRVFKATIDHAGRFKTPAEVVHV